MTDQPLLLLVHSPLVGPYMWAGVADQLRAKGHAVVVPSLRLTAGDKAPFWPRQVDAAVAEIDQARALRPPVVVVAHSGAGALLPAIGKRLGSRARAFVFVDAGLPTPGLSWAATAPAALVARLEPTVRDGYVAPWHEWFGGEDALAGLLPDARQRSDFVSELDPLSWEMLQEPRPACPNWPPAPVGYLLLSEPYEVHAAEAERLGWPTERFAGHHLSMVTHPADVAARLVALVRETCTFDK